MAINRNRPKGKGGFGGSKENDETFDASPVGDHDISAHGSNGKRPHSIKETEAWKKGSNGMMKAWHNYTSYISASFSRMGRFEQEGYITKFSMVLTIGIAVVALQCFYQVLLQPIRVISLPIVVGIAWYLGNKVIAPTMIKRFERYLNPED